MFLTDVFIIENLQILEEASSDKPMKVRGIFQRAEEANNNKRVYPKTVLESQMGKLQPLIEGRRLCGELDHPSNDTVKLSNASHLITKLEMKGNEVLGEAEILNTPAGLTAKALIKGGVQIGISSRGMGTLSEAADGTKKVNEDFKLVTFDLVADPSTRGAYPTLAENTQYQEILKKSTEERVFIQLLEEEIDNRLKLDEAKLIPGMKPGQAEKQAKKAKKKAKELEPKEKKEKKEKDPDPGKKRRAMNVGLDAAQGATGAIKGLSSRFANLGQAAVKATGAKSDVGGSTPTGGITARYAEPRRQALAGAKGGRRRAEDRRKSGGGQRAGDAPRQDRREGEGTEKRKNLAAHTEVTLFGKRLRESINNLK